MSIINDFRQLYNNIPKQEQSTQVVVPQNSELLQKTMEHLNKQPQIAPNINRKN